MTLNFYPTLQRCSYLRKIIISVSFVSISFHIYAVNFVLLSLKTFYSDNLYISLNTCVDFRDLSC